MPKPQDPIPNLRIAAPCQAAWDAMAGDERVRHCSLCSLNVYNFAEMTRDEVRELLLRTEGRVCARLYRRADGTVLTRDCPTGLRALRQRASRVAAAVITALFSLPVIAFGGTACEKPRFKQRGAKVRIEIEQVATPQPAAFTGVVRDEAGDLLPGVRITLRDEAAKREIATVTDAKGAFNITSLNEGTYRVDVTLVGFTSATLEDFQLKSNEVTHASVALRVDSATATMGVVVMPMDQMMSNDPLSFTFPQDFINKLPL